MRGTYVLWLAKIHSTGVLHLSNGHLAQEGTHCDVSPRCSGSRPGMAHRLVIAHIFVISLSTAGTLAKKSNIFDA